MKQGRPQAVPNLGPYPKTTRMKSLKAGLPVLAAALVLAPPGAALAGSVVPPGNPAAIQYTEAFPTSRGPTDAEHSTGHKRPDQTLGGRNTKRLEDEGKDGRETARVAAETAPETVAAQATGSGSGSAAGSAPKGGDGGSGTGVSHKGDGAAGASPQNVAAADDGGSGLDRVAGQATGLDTSEGTGLLLPLVLLAILAWGSAYVLRRRKRAAR
jgi:hypothetical protein